MYEQLKEARSDRDKQRVETILRDSIEILQAALKIEYSSVEVSDVSTDSESTENDF